MISPNIGDWWARVCAWKNLVEKSTHKCVPIVVSTTNIPKLVITVSRPI